MSADLSDSSNPHSRRISSRKEEHVRLVVEQNVMFQGKSAGWESFEPEYNALPELNIDEIVTECSFLGHNLAVPFMMTGMTGGYGDAERINASLATVCNHHGMAIGVGSQRQILASDAFIRSYNIVRECAPSVPVIANLGAAEIVHASATDDAKLLVDVIHADALAIHCNALQELMQPEGTPTFRGVLAGIERCVRALPVPVIVKEVGAGISARVARALLDTGVTYIDVAGAGGTSWAGVELLRSTKRHLDLFRDVGIPTAQCLREVCVLRPEFSFTCIASGGISNGLDAAKALALGADVAGAARPFLTCLQNSGEEALSRMIYEWKEQLRATMFIAGAKDLPSLRRIALRSADGTVVREAS